MASIATDNGRAAEFIRRKVYKDKSRCYECGDEGHLSYECHKNQLGPRERPQLKRVRREGGGSVAVEFQEEEEVRFEDENWASVVDTGADERLLRSETQRKQWKKEKKKKYNYFSDESEEDDGDD